MRANPYNNPAPRKQLANVEVRAAKLKSNYAIICFDNDQEEVLHSKARNRAIADYGSQIHEANIEYKILSREDLIF